MRKIIYKIAGTLLGLSLAFGVGTALGSHKNAQRVSAADVTVTKTSFDAISGDLDTNISFEAQKGGASTAPAVNSSQIRIYQNGGLLLVTPKNSSTISSITVGSSMATKVQVKVGDGNYSSDHSISANGEYVESGLSATGVVTFKCTGTDKYSRLYLNKLSVTYTTSGGDLPTYYTVTFDMQGHGDAVSSQSIASGGTVNKPTDPVASGYVFGGWYEDADCGTAWDFTNNTISGDTIIYALWTEKVVDPNEFIISLADNSIGSETAYVKTGQTTTAYNGGSFTADLAWNKINPKTGQLAGNKTTQENLQDIGDFNFFIRNTTAMPKPIKSISIDGVSGTYDATKVYAMVASTEITNQSVSDSVAGTDESGKVTWTFTPSVKYFALGAASGFTSGTVTASSITIKVEDGTSIPLTDIGLKATEEVAVESAVTLIPILTPSDANTDNTLVWSTSDDEIATVTQSGVVTGVKEGTATITVNATDIGKSASCVVTVNPLPPVPVTHTIAQCYSVAKGTSVSFNGVYMGSYGTSTYNGLFFADGEYGIMIFGSSSIPEGWEVGHTVVAVSGTTDFYNGLVQIKSASFQATTATVSTPVVYNFTGSENSPVALSRKTSLSGTVTNISGTISKTTDATITIDIGGGKSAIVFIKKNSFTDEQIADYVEKFVNGNYVVVTGFLNYYNKATTAVTDVYDSSKFQVIIPTIISTVVYTADAFATDFKSSTKSACELIESERLSALQSVWGDVAASYSALSDAEKENFISSGANANIKDALARYCHICGKYNTETVKVLTEFVEGATIIYKVQNVIPRSASSDSNASTVIIVVVALTSITSIGVLLVIKRKRSLVK